MSCAMLGSTNCRVLGALTAHNIRGNRAHSGAIAFKCVQLPHILCAVTAHCARLPRTMCAVTAPVANQESQIMGVSWDMFKFHVSDFYSDLWTYN